MIDVTITNPPPLRAPMESGLLHEPRMAYREFTDADGQQWRVWSTVPSQGGSLRGGFNEGWLTFERTSGKVTEVRRLVPVPADWDACGESELDELRRAASFVQRKGADDAPDSARDERAREERARG